MQPVLTRPQPARVRRGRDVAVVGVGGAHRYADVVDQGATWRFRFTKAGDDPQPPVLGAGALEAAGWRVTTPR